MYSKEVKVTRIMPDGEVRVYSAKRWFATDEEKIASKDRQKNRDYRRFREDLEDREELNRIEGFDASTLFNDDLSRIEESITEYLNILSF